MLASEGDSQQEPAMETKLAEHEWLCANCHTVCSLARCPTCSGIRVKIKDSGDDDNESRSKFLLERVIPSPSPTQRWVTLPNPRSPVTTGAGALKKTTEPEDEELGVNMVTPQSTLDSPEYGVVRPSDPIAGVLFTAPSPLPSTRKEIAIPDDSAKSPTARKRFSNLRLDSPKLHKIAKPVV